MKTKITLVGTYHSDSNGQEKLSRVLSDLNPNILSIEFCNESSKILDKMPRYMDYFKHYLRRKGQPPELAHLIDNVSDYVRPPFEYPAVREYCQQNNIALHLIDSPTAIRNAAARMLKNIRHALAELPIIQKSDIPLEFTKQDYSQLEEQLVSLMGSIQNRKISKKELIQIMSSLKNQSLIGERDGYMADRIRELISQNKNSKLVHIVGALHLIDDPLKETLYSRIKDLNPERIFIYARPSHTQR